LQRKAGGLHLVVVAADTILIGESGLGWSGLLRNSGWNAQSGKSGAREHTPTNHAPGSHSPKFITNFHN
jgi:hypothetical protein